MSPPFNEYPAGPSYSDNANAGWHSHQNMTYDYPAPYDYSSGTSLGESSGFSDSAPFSPTYDYTNSPEMFSFEEYSMPLSPSCSASSSSSSCSDAPITPYYVAPPLPNTGILFTGLDGAGCGEYCDDGQSEYTYEGWEEDATQTFPGVAMPESSVRSSAMHTDYDDDPAALWACESASAQLQYFDASQQPSLASQQPSLAPEPPTYASFASSDFPAVTSSAVSPPHAHEYPSSYPPPSYPPPSNPPVACLSPAALSCPPPLKVHQPQPRRSIPVVSLSALASSSLSSEPIPQPSVHMPRSSPTLSPLELQFPSCMTSYSGLSTSADNLPMVAYPPHCSCPSCYSIA
ncbi:hypothetical protein C8R43DRAFT_960829 [Mycena crocata]|nr:hypothetical protein C8R43DRAFT_960829 [Mycena crocata]